MMRPNKDQQTGDMGFAGMNNTAVKGSSTRYAHNQWSGHSNDGRTVNYGRGPTKGNDGKCGHSGFKHEGKVPPASVPDTHPKSAPGMPQYRGVGGTPMPKTDKTNFNMGRGPTKGNQQ